MTTEVEVKESKGIKETLEILEGLKVCVPAVVEIAADMKLTTSDFKPAMEAIKQHSVVVAAIDNAKEALPEAKDLDMQELALIGAKTLELVKLTREAHSRGKAA